MVRITEAEDSTQKEQAEGEQAKKRGLFGVKPVATLPRGQEARLISPSLIHSPSSVQVRSALSQSQVGEKGEKGEGVMEDVMKCMCERVE